MVLVKVLVGLCLWIVTVVICDAQKVVDKDFSADSERERLQGIQIATSGNVPGSIKHLEVTHERHTVPNFHFILTRLVGCLFWWALFLPSKAASILRWNHGDAWNDLAVTYMRMGSPRAAMVRCHLPVSLTLCFCCFVLHCPH